METRAAVDKLSRSYNSLLSLRFTRPIITADPVFKSAVRDLKEAIDALQEQTGESYDRGSEDQTAK